MAYKYAQTRNRVHRVYVEGGQAYKVEQCNLDDASYFRLLDIAPEGTHCKYCWKLDLEEEKEEEPTVPTDPNSSPIDEAKLVATTPRLAIRKKTAAVALAGMGLVGLVAGVVASPDLVQSSDLKDQASFLLLIDEIVERRFIEHELDPSQHHVHIDPAPTHGPPAPTVEPSFVPVEPSPSPSPETSGEPGGRSLPTPGPTLLPVPRPTTSPAPTSSPAPTPTPAPTVQPPPPTPMPTPTPQPTLAPSPSCFRPGNAVGNPDDCKWPHDP